MSERAFSLALTADESAFSAGRDESFDKLRKRFAEPWGKRHDLGVLRTTLHEQPADFASARLLRAFDAFVVLRMAELEEEAGRLGQRLAAREAVRLAKTS